MSGFQMIEGHGAPIKAWTEGVPVEHEAQNQLRNIAALPFIHSHIAVMPDVHLGKGATVGSVIPTKGAIIPAAVGVDIGCGMMAMRTSLTANDLPDSLARLRGAIERNVPHGNGPGGNHRETPSSVETAYRDSGLDERYRLIIDKHPKASAKAQTGQLATLGGGNHFIEVCLDEDGQVWVMLHSGSRGIGNAIGTYFIALARQDMERLQVNLPDRDLAYFPEGTPHFADYVEAVDWAQRYAMRNREEMLATVLAALRRHLPPFDVTTEAVNCHHNYVAYEHHFDADVWVTRKGAIRAGKGELGIVPGSMGTRSYIVRGLGNPDSFESSAHGAGRRMSRTQARHQFTAEDMVAQTQGVICRKDAGVVDEIPGAYKDIDEVMANQRDLTEVLHTLKQVVCVKG